ncbi:MAG: ABC transporter permease [Candidatus Marinimicrobia bacterium]|nr:ABC transporter permease [Candidatus Neomarinimicrobiota bacterium]
MIAYCTRRLVSTVFVLIIVSTITFFLSHSLPGDPASLWVGDHPTKEQLETAKNKLGFDRPLIEQYVSFLQNVITLDLGVSLRTRQPVLTELGRRFSATFELVFFSMLLALSFGFFLGLKTAIASNTRPDQIIRGVGYLGLSFPVFWLGMILQLLFFGILQWLPLQGRHSGFSTLDIDLSINSGLFLFDTLFSGEWELFCDGLTHIFLPMMTLAFGVFGLILRTTRSAMMETMSEPFFKTYLAYGFEPAEAIQRSAYKNTLVPVSTVSGLSFGLMLGGTFLVESIFDWPGLGQFSVLSILTNDFPAIMGVTLFYTLTYVIINFFIDLLYPMIDPRIGR